MDFCLSTIAAGSLIFATTNIDDLFLLTLFFADASLRTYQIILGQFIGIAILLTTSLVCARSALLLPGRWLHLLGIIPLGLGLKQLWVLLHTRRLSWEEEEGQTIQRQKGVLARKTHSIILTIVGVTIANGGDN